MRRENASVAGLARQLGCAWDTVNTAVISLLARLDTDQHRFQGVTTLGVDEHIWHHGNPWRRGPKEFTGMVDLSRDKEGRVHARLLDLVPGRSGPVYAAWLDARGDVFKQTVKLAALDPFRGYKNAIDTRLDDARAVLDAFHVVKLGYQALDQVRCRVQQETLGHRGQRNDPLYKIRRLLVTGVERLSDHQWARLENGLAAGDPNQIVTLAWDCARRLRGAYTEKNLNAGLRQAIQIVRALPSCPIPEIARLGRTLKQWKPEFLAYWTTKRTSNGGTEAINNLIELHRRVARGFTNPHNYRLRMLLIGGAFNHPELNYPHRN
jgi:transposase